MTIRVGLMGFGRIGRNLFRILLDREDIDIAVISDIADHDGLEYLLRYDTILGRFPYEVSIKDGHLFTLGKQITMLNARDPGEVKWSDYDIDVVIDATARPRSREELTKHIDQGAKKVVLCTLPEDNPDATIVMGINEKTLKPSDQLIYNSSITTHCAAPIVGILDKAFGIERLCMTTIHAYTNAQSLADVPADDLRSSRAAGENIIPIDTVAGSILEQLFPHLENKIDALALNVPVPNGSLVDMTIFTEKPVTVDGVNEVVRTAAADIYPDLIEYCIDPIVSSDVITSPYSCTFDSKGTQVLGSNLLKTISWFDNGWGYCHQAVDLIEHLEMSGALR